MPRDHHFRFAKILIPQMVSSNPDRMFEELTGPKREAFLMFLWQEAGKESRDGTIPHVDTTPLAPGLPAQMTKLDSLGSSKAGQYEIVFLTMPAALQPNEALYIALVREGRTPRVFFWERCMGNTPTETHPSECVCSAVDGMGGRANYGFHRGLSVDDFRRVLGEVLGVQVPAPTAEPGMEAVMRGAAPAGGGGFESSGSKSWGMPQKTPQPSAPQESAFASSGAGFASSGPLASPVGGAPIVAPGAPIFPLLKAKDWPHKALAVTMPVPGAHHPDAPCISFARNANDHYVMVTKQEMPNADVNALLQQAVSNLSNLPTDMAMIGPGICMSGGSDFTADRLLDPVFMRQMHRRLGSEDILVSVPHRMAIYAMALNAPPATTQMFETLVHTERTRQPPPGAPVAPNLLFQVKSGKIWGVRPYGSASVAPPERKKAFASALAVLGALFLFMLVNFVGVPLLSTFAVLAMASAAGLLYRPGTHVPTVSAVCFAIGIVGMSGMMPIVFSFLIAAVAWTTLAWALSEAMPKPALGKSIAVGVGVLTLINYFGEIYFYAAPDLPMLAFWCRVLLMGGAAVIVAAANKPQGR